MNTLVCSAYSFTLYCNVILLVISLQRYYPNEPEVLHIHRKRLTSTLKNKVDTT